MIKAVIFDVDGMIVHGKRFSHRLAKKYNISYILMLKDKTRKLTKLEVSFSNDSFIIYHIDIK